ncbi:MAG TPA: ABC transporter permease [Acidimicrobiia bacterium]
MFAFVVRRLLTALVVVLVATIVVFALVSARGDPLQDLRHRPGVSQQTVHNLEREYHLNDSRPSQYVNWLGDFVQGDWGTSFRTQQPVTDMVGTATWNSLLLVGTALVLSVMLALCIGVVSAVRQYSLFDHAATSFSYFGFSMPDFFFALLLQLFVVVVLHETLGIDVLYVQGKYSVGQQGDVVNLIEHMVLPVAVLMLTSVAAWSRYQRDSMLEVLNTDYVRTARAKGVPRRQVIRRHALRNALIPFVTVVAIDAGVLLGGVVVVERVFDWPGLGLLFFDALERSDYPVILAWMAVATAFVVLFNLFADILYAALDPRIRVGGPYRRRRARTTVSATVNEPAMRPLP